MHTQKRKESTAARAQLFHKMATRMHGFTILLIMIAAAVATATATATAADDQKLAKIPDTLDVGALTRKAYVSFLRRLRQGAAASYSNQVPVLPTYNAISPAWIDIKLVSGANETTLRLRADTLFPAAYLEQGSDKWLELGRSGDTKLIPGSLFLGFRADYASLESAAGKSVLDIPLSKSAFSAAVATLAGSTSYADRARALIEVAQVITEAARFFDIAGYIAPGIDTDEAVKLKAWMRTDLETKWKDYSYVILRADVDSCFVYTPVVINGKKVKTTVDLAKRLGVLFRDPNTLSPPCGDEEEEPEIEMVVRA